MLEANYRAKMRYSPDYQGMEPTEALRDFKQRIQKYLDVYEPISDRRMHYIKVVDMVTGRGYMDVNRISGESFFFSGGLVLGGGLRMQRPPQHAPY